MVVAGPDACTFTLNRRRLNAGRPAAAAACISRLFSARARPTPPPHSSTYRYPVDDRPPATDAAPPFYIADDNYYHYYYYYYRVYYMRYALCVVMRRSNFRGNYKPSPVVGDEIL